MKITKNKILFGIIMALMIFLISCTPAQNTPQACTMEAKLCPDGTSVGRQGPDCEFAKCPDVKVGMANPASVYCEQNGGAVNIITDKDGSQRADCILADKTVCDEWAYFRGECGAEYTVAETTNVSCSLDSDCTTPTEYLIRSSCPYTSKCIEESCAVICPKVPTESQSACTCPSGYVQEGDVCNPQCYYSTPKCLMPSIQCTRETAEKECGSCPQFSPPAPGWCDDGKIVASEVDKCGCRGPPSCVKETTAQTKCTTRSQICTMDYNPVCGYFDTSIKCFKYPCAATYGNACTACADDKVAFYEQGECPK